jgi:hypothetical protein
MDAESKTLEFLDHPYWGRIHRRAGYDGWWLAISDLLPDGRPIRILIDFDEPDNQTVQANYQAIKSKWPMIWHRILVRTQELKTKYECGDVPIIVETDWFNLTPPTKPIEENGEWSVMLQSPRSRLAAGFQGVG